MNASAFSATYSDFKLVKTRGVVSISFEVPVEQAQTVLDVLGGMPVAAAEVWCAVARLTNTGDAVGPSTLAANSVSTASASPRGEPVASTKTAFRDMRMPNQAGILCAEVPFQKFLVDTKRVSGVSPASSADYVRRHCNVASRSDIRPRTPSGDRWTKLVDEYRTWMHSPELVS